MHPIQLIHNAVDSSELVSVLESHQRICAITGLCGSCVPRKNVLLKSFTNGDILARPDSDWVGVDAYQVLKYKWQRKSSWFCDGVVFERLDKKKVVEKVFSDELPEIWSGYVTTSYKKHGVLRAKVNTGGKRIWLFEMSVVDCSDMNMVREWYSVLEDAFLQGITRKMMLGLSCPPMVMGKIGVDVWLNFYRWAKDKYRSALYLF